MADGTPIGVVDPDLQRYIATRMVMDADLVCRAREDPNVYVEACGRIEAGQWVGRPPGAHRMMQDHLTRASNNGGASTALVLMPVGHAKTTTARWRIEWEIGRNVNLRVLMMSATSQLPEGVLSGIKGDITDNPFTQAVFPHLRPGRKMGQSDWSSDRIHVHRSDNLSDPTIQCAGLTTKILGKRLDLIYLDDMLNTDNTLTPYMRKQVSDKVQSEVMSRRVPHLPSRAWLTGHVWTEDDLVSTMMRQIGAYKMRLGARVQRHKSGRIITSADPEWSETLDWCPLLPGLFTKARLEARYRELGWAARHMLDNRFMLKSGQGFSPEGIARALVNGKGETFKPFWNPLTTGCPTYTGVDLSTGEGDDYTVIITVARLPTGRRQILEIQSGKWEGPEIMRRLRDVYSRYHSTIAVENNGAQKFILQGMRDANALVTPVLDHHTGSNKHAMKWGIKHMEMELADPGLWIFPRPNDMLEAPSDDMMALCDGALGYSRDEKHTSDWLMAWWICWLQIVKDEGESLK